jgi:hypothetical protein
MKKYWVIACCSLLLALTTTVLPANATNTANDNCAENPLIVDDGPAGPKALRVADGYICGAVTLEIRTSLNVTDHTLEIVAKEILIEPLAPADPADPAQRVQVINNDTDGLIRIRSMAGNVVFNGATVKAKGELRIGCAGSSCRVQADQSDLIAAANFNPPGGGGNLLIFAAIVDIETTNTHGGDLFEITASGGGIKLICKTGDQTCKDPTTGTPPDILLAQCEDPANPGQLLFPCFPTFNTAAELKSVCIGSGTVTCNGGHKEKRFTATGDIDITNSKITSVDHITFTSNGGKILADGAVIETGDTLKIFGKNGVTMKGATFTAGATLNVSGGTGCPVNSLCIDATDANVQGAQMNWFARGGSARIRLCGGTFIVPGVKVPAFNGDGTPPYGASVLEDAAECGADGPATIN